MHFFSNFSTRHKVIALILCVTLSAFGIHYSRKPVLMPAPTNTETLATELLAELPASRGKISIECSKLDYLRCRDLFRVNLIKKGFQPISVIIENETNNCIKFSPSSITLKTMPLETVLKKAQHNTMLCNMIWKIAGAMHPMMTAIGTIHTVLENKENSRIQKRVLSCAATDQLIEPNTALESIVFLEQEDFNPEFNMYLTNMDSNKNMLFFINMAKKSRTVRFV